MNENERIFDDYTKKYGGLFKGENPHIKRIKSDFDEKINLYKIGRENLKIPDVNLNFINNDKFQALVFKSSGRYFIGISIGTIRSMFNFFNYLMSQPYFMSDFGNADEEIEQQIDIIPNSKKLIDNFYSYDFSIKPKSIIRKSFSYQLLYKSINYLIMHEFAHITHGHLDFNKQTDSHFMLFEEDVVKTYKTNIRKALEYDADSSATTTSLLPNPLFGLSEHNISIELRYLTIATYSLFKLNSLKEYRIEDLPYKTYPAPDQRISAHLSLATTFFMDEKARFDFDINPMVDNMVNTYFECLKSFSKMVNYEPLKDKSLFFTSAQGYDYHRQVSKGWNQIREELEKNAFVPIAPADNYSDEDIGFDYNTIIKKWSDKMWMVIIEYDFDNDILIFEDLSLAEERYLREVESGQLAYLTKVLKTNM